MPDDYTKSTFTTIFVEYNFPLRVQPCKVTTYTRDVVVGDINYNVGAASLTTGSYTFGEDPICDYPETVTVTNLPAFASHNSGTADFTVN